MRSQLFLNTFALIVVIIPASATTLFVADTGDDSDGLSWETAFNSINDAVILAVTDDKIHVKVGIYHENILLATPIKLIGGFLGEEASGRQGLTVASARSVIRPVSEGIVVEITSDLYVKAFEISGAFGDAVSGRGNAILIRDSTVEISDCKLNDNAGFNGSGMECLDSNVSVR